MLSRFFKKKDKSPTHLLVAQLNARLQPIHRGEFFEDPLDEELKKMGFGEVSGGGSLLSADGEIEYCDIELQITDSSAEVMRFIIDTLESLGAPKGSKLKIVAEHQELLFGKNEGLAVYLNGIDLPPETYEQCDSNFVYSEFDRLLEGEGRVLSYWQGPRETAFYIYGKSFETMKARLSDFIESYPLCQQSRVEQIA